MSQKSLPIPQYRLTLTKDSCQVLQRLSNKIRIGVLRPDGKVDVAIPFNLLDQLQTFALAKENLSDTLLRIEQMRGSIG